MLPLSATTRLEGETHRLTAATAGFCKTGGPDNAFADLTWPSTPITFAQQPTHELVPAWPRADIPATFESGFGPHSLALRLLVPGCQEVRSPEAEIETLGSRPGPPCYPELRPPEPAGRRSDRGRRADPTPFPEGVGYRAMALSEAGTGAP